MFYEAKTHGWRDEGGHQKPTREELTERRRIATERAVKEAAEIGRERVEAASKAAAINAARIAGKTDEEIRALVLKLEAARKTVA